MKDQTTWQWSQTDEGSVLIAEDSALAVVHQHEGGWLAISLVPFASREDAEDYALRDALRRTGATLAESPH